MRTKASFKGHAIHQMLIPFPIGFFVGAFLFDLLGYLFSNSSFYQTSYYLGIAGIISALAAALPGFIDFLFSVPPNSSGKKRAVQHLSVNLTATALFTAAVLLREDPSDTSATVFVTELLGISLLTIGGWLGGTLVNRNFIGPDHRYANAGKWKEKYFSEEQAEYEAADSNELKVNQMKLLRIKDKRIVLGRTEEGYISFDDSCTHRGGSLAGGIMICGTVQCLWHGSQFDVKTGKVKSGPAQKNINTYKVTERDGRVFVSF